MKAIALLAIAGAAAVASAQTARLEWQVSTDNGATWNSGLTTLTTGGTVQVRVLGSFNVAGGLGFAGAAFDATVSNILAGDSVANFNRTFNFAAQTLAASTFGTTIKIDDNRDTLAPGAGTRWVQPSQGVPAFTPTFVTANPAVLFTYDLTVSSEEGVRSISHVGNGAAAGVVQIYTTANGGQARISNANTTVVGAQVEVIPAPGAVALLGLGGLVAGRRRR
ncbi:MAG: hypothetical protein SFZ23_08100 [Planctomycetota bacterium]|nr:hypothetical protein [Planctomycetota bacterium]